MTFDPYELSVRLRTLLDVTDCASVLLTHSNGTVIQATRDGDVTILADERTTFDPDDACYGVGPAGELLAANLIDVELVEANSAA